MDYRLQVIAEKMLRVCLWLLSEDSSCLVSAQLVMRLENEQDTCYNFPCNFVLPIQTHKTPNSQLTPLKASNFIIE